MPARKIVDIDMDAKKTVCETWTGFASWLSLPDLRLVSCAQSSCNGFADRCSDETAYSTGTESVARALEVLVNQYDWLPGPLTFRVVKRLKFSTVGIVGITLV